MFRAFNISRDIAFRDTYETRRYVGRFKWNILENSRHSRGKSEIRRSTYDETAHGATPIYVEYLARK